MGPTNKILKPQASSLAKRIVMIDDQETYTEALASAFDMGGNLKVVGRATSGNDGVDIALELQPDLVLCDYRIPGETSGVDCAYRLRSNGFNGEIVILTGFAAPNVLAEAALVSDVRVISKDLSVVDIIDNISTRQEASESHSFLADQHRTSTDPGGSVKLLLLAVVVLFVVILGSVLLLNSSPRQASSSPIQTGVAGVGLERPFVVIDGTATNVRVTVEIDGKAIDAFVSSSLPTTIAIDAGSANAEVHVTVENLDGVGTTTCAIGAAKEIVASNTARLTADAICIGVLP